MPPGGSPACGPRSTPRSRSIFIQNAASGRRSSWPRTVTRRGSRLPWACASATTGRSAWRCGPTMPAPGTPTTTSKPGWTCGMGDGTSNVGVGLLNTSQGFGKIDYRALLRRWLAAMPPEWGLTEENRTEPVRGAALPMGFNRTPHYTRGLLLAGDAGGMINPFNGEGIAYALDSGEVAARVITQALARPTRASAEAVLHGYPRALRDAYGGYYALGRQFVKLIGHPSVMKFATRHGIKRPALMRITLKLLGNLTEPRGGDAVDRVINALAKLTPAA